MKIQYVSYNVLYFNSSLWRHSQESALEDLSEYIQVEIFHREKKIISGLKSVNLSYGAWWETFAVVSYLYQTYNPRCMKVYTYFILTVSLISVQIEAREDVVEYMLIKDQFEST